MTEPATSPTPEALPLSAEGQKSTICGRTREVTWGPGSPPIATLICKLSKDHGERHDFREEDPHCFCGHSEAEEHGWVDGEYWCAECDSVCLRTLAKDNELHGARHG